MNDKFKDSIADAMIEGYGLKATLAGQLEQMAGTADRIVENIERAQGALSALSALKGGERAERLTFGVLLRWGSLWIGAHWSGKNRRLSVNLVPFVTFWVVLKGGVKP